MKPHGPRLRPGALLAALICAGLLAGPGPGAGRTQGPVSAGVATQDGGAGRILDREGTAARRPVGAARWGPAKAGGRVEPGDWLKTGTRGAHALVLGLADGAGVLLGPATMIEAESGSRLSLVRGEVEIVPAPGGPVSVRGPGGETLSLRSRAVLRASGSAMEVLENDPGWLRGYHEQASTEATGSLLAKVDGRDVPLTLGYQKVTVDIRDQIARTVIEESFLNHTSAVLEGVFYFPLPADASISGFGMWIRGELVQGEIVERQRARQIYESILREKRDPALLEWSGGNLFKARVYPILGEKRIRIAYTQVLPAHGGAFTYRYGLRSDMTRLHPLERLELRVRIHSAQALDGVTASLPCRVRQTDHAASVEFSAEEYAPERDFELEVRFRPGADRLTLIPHRRGDDGYFLLFFQPGAENPAAASVPGPAGRGDPPPLRLLVLADTSGSMSGPPREAQLRFVDALLGALGEADSFQLLTCDAEVRAAFGAPAASTLEARQAALAFLESRPALGWSDLESAFSRAAAMAGPGTQVVYVGDGIVTAGEADAAALAGRLAAMTAGRGSFHAVVPGPRSEPIVLRALARAGGGSLRTLRGLDDPAGEAFSLLEEMTSPAVKDLRVEFEGFAAAAVHPAQLPNLPLGRQQVVVGRFDPLAGPAHGRVRIRGTLRGQDVVWEAAVDLQTAGDGNAFIPRLWARRRLDHLLESGSAPENRERILALSEDFQVITPYTSFLVLESEEDRRRFAVEKAYRIRDGEEFFAEGRDRARHALLRQQMLAAKGWRLRLREELLSRLADMERPLTRFLRPVGPPQAAAAAIGLGGGAGWEAESSRRKRYRGPGDMAAPTMSEAHHNGGEPVRAGAVTGEGDILAAPQEPSLADAMVFAEAEGRGWGAEVFEPARPAAPPFRARNGFVGGMGGPPWWSPEPDDTAGPFDALLPSFSALREPELERIWPPEVRQLLERLDRRARLAAPGTGLAVRILGRTFDRRRREQAWEEFHVLGAHAWYQEPGHRPGDRFTREALLGGVRIVFKAGWRLGRRRPAREADSGAWRAPFPWLFGDFARSYASLEAELHSVADGNVRVVFLRPADGEPFLEILVDPERALVLEQRTLEGGVVRRRVLFGEFQRTAGAWWPGEVRSLDEEGRLESLQRVQLEALDAAGLTQRVAAALGDLETALLFDPEPELAAARQADREGRARLKDHWRLLRRFAFTAQWDAARPHWEAVARATAGLKGLVPLRLTWLAPSRRREEAAQLLREEARALAAEPQVAAYGRALLLLGFSRVLNPGGEKQELLALLKPVFDRATGILDARLPWDRHALSAARALRRPAAVFARQKAMARAWPYEAGIQVDHASALAQRERPEAGLEWLRQAEAAHGPWSLAERRQLRRGRAQILWNAYRLEDFVQRLPEWEAEEPGLVDSGLLAQYLTALAYLDRAGEAEFRVRIWLREGAADPLDPVQAARLEAGLGFALGRGWGLRARRLSAARLELLAATARALLQIEARHGTAGRILQDVRFRRSNAGQRLLQDLFTLTAASAADWEPVRLQRFIRWLRNGRFVPQGEGGAWKQLYAQVWERWTASEDPHERSVLAAILQGSRDPELVLRLRRREFAEAGNDPARRRAARALLGTLMARPWTAEREAELCGLLPHALAHAETAEDDGEDLHEAILIFYDFSGWLPEARTDAALAAMPDINRLPRRRLQALEAALQREARVASAALLSGITASLPADLRDWARIERLYLLARTGHRIAEARQESLDLLQGRAERHSGGAFSLAGRILAARAASTCTWLLARPGAEAGGDFEAAFRGFLASQAEAGTDLLDWKQRLADLHLALDRRSALTALLRRAFGGGRAAEDLRWGPLLGRVLAEEGELEAAVEVFQILAGWEALSPEDWLGLAEWYTALDRPEASARARRSAWSARSLPDLAYGLRNALSAYQRRGGEVPPELDPGIPARLTVLFRKETRPGNQIGLLRSFYAATRDFRLLECLPEGVLGHSSQQIYPFLRSAGRITGLIGEEATADRLLARLRELHAAAGTPVDRRALRMLEFVVELQAAGQSQGAERHRRAARAALREAVQGAWQPGEARLMAEFLASQGAMPTEALASDVLGVMRRLPAAAQDPFDRFEAGRLLAKALWDHQRQADALRALEGAVERYRGECGGVLREDASSALSSLAAWHRFLGDWRGAESVWQRELEGAPAASRAWIEGELYRLYQAALLAGGTVSLGRGEELYAAIRDLLLARLEERTNEDFAGDLVRLLCDTWQRLEERGRGWGLRADTVRFAFTRLPGVLRLYQYRNGQNMVGLVAECLRRVAGAVPAVEFLLVRAENEPAWLTLQGQDFWARHGGILARARDEAQHLPGALAERLLARVLVELREDLRSRRAGSRVIYSARHPHFWSEQRAAFRQAALTFLRDHQDSEAAVRYAAEYLYLDLGAWTEAITALQEARAAGRLGLDAQAVLARFLQGRRRWRESLPVVRELVAGRPGEAGFRVMLMRALDGTGERRELVRALEEAGNWFREAGRWDEPVLTALGDACLGTGLPERAAALYEEAIALRTREATRRGVGDGVLSGYYRSLAQARSAAGDTVGAVNAAAGAIVARGASLREHRAELRDLEAVLRAALDAGRLEAYLAHLEAETAASGLENPVLRRAIGRVLFERRMYAQAATQLRRAVDARPDDLESRRMLVEVLDRCGHETAAAAAALERARAAGRNADLFRQAGDRLAALERAEEAERAWTEMVESLPEEAASHTALAQIREGQGRWRAAETQWRHVIRIRTDEPEGWLGLAGSLLRLGRRDEAMKIARHLLGTEWPARFGDVHGRARSLLAGIRR